MSRMLMIFGYLLSIPVANWMIGHIGFCSPNGPCVLPVFPGVMAPSGTLMIGVILLLRDLVQRRYGIPTSLTCMAGGTILSALIAPPSLVLASAAAFLFSELVDFSVYTPLARRRFVLALVASCLAGAVADSVLFLWLAFGSLNYFAGQVIGKIYAVSLFALWRTTILAKFAR